jgi:2-oxoglutarate dehydrogenase N-terminus
MVHRASKYSRTFAPNRDLSTKVDSFLSGSSSVYIEQMYDSWRKEPTR